MKIKGILIFILLISNITWSYFYFTADTPRNYNGIQIYNLEGSGKNWDVKNYKIVVTPDKILRGYAELIYIGDPKNIKDINFYEITIYEENHNNEQIDVYNTSVSIEGSSNSIIDIFNLNDVGSIISPYFYDEKLRTKENYENSTVEISWKSKNGTVHKEKIYLNINDEIIFKNDEE